MIFTCGTTVAELAPELTTLFIRANREWYVPVEPLYYSIGYQNCCCHCVFTDRLRITKDAWIVLEVLYYTLKGATQQSNLQHPKV